MSEADAGDTLDFDRSVLGVDVDIGSYQVTKEEIIAYARALGETNPLYVDEEAAREGPIRDRHRARRVLHLHALQARSQSQAEGAREQVGLHGRSEH